MEHETQLTAQPVMPPAGEADPLAGLVPAAPTSEPVKVSGSVRTQSEDVIAPVEAQTCVPGQHRLQSRSFMNEVRDRIYRGSVVDPVTLKCSLCGRKPKIGTPHICPKVGVHYPKYTEMPTLKLDAYIKNRLEECYKASHTFTQRAAQLLPALLETESRFNKQQGARSDLHELKVQTWHEYLKSLGVNPSTFRGWKSDFNRMSNPLQKAVMSDEDREELAKKKEER